MITANMHDAKTHLSRLVRAVVEQGETVILQQNGKPVAEIRAFTPSPIDRCLIARNPALKVKLAPDYDPAEPLSEDEWPDSNR